MINIINKNKTYITSSGFTLSEVLITLGVIGIVAAMTLPTIVTKYRQFVAINKIKKCIQQFPKVYYMHFLIEI